MGLELDILTGHPEHDLLFVATQAARAVGLKDPATAISDYRKTKTGGDAGRTLNSVTGNLPIKDIPKDQAGRRLKGITTLFTESEVVRLLMRGHTAKAYEFQTWIAEDVVPTIRKTGKYDLSESTSDFAKELQAFRLRFEEQDKVIATQAQEIASLIPLRGQVGKLKLRAQGLSKNPH